MNENDAASATAAAVGSPAPPGLRQSAPLDTAMMERALALAARAGRLGNVPVGAVVVGPNPETSEVDVIGQAGNLRETLQDPTAHAELLALREAAMRLGSWRLDGATVYVTLEPCAMCAGALVQARVARVVYGAREPKMGAHASVHRLFEGSATRVDEHPGAAEAGARLLAEFFSARRPGAGR